jgi:hypothetical protein
MSALDEAVLALVRANVTDLMLNRVARGAPKLRPRIKVGVDIEQMADAAIEALIGKVTLRERLASAAEWVKYDGRKDALVGTLPPEAVVSRVREKLGLR